MGFIKWCCFWNTVYDGTIASGIHMLISTITYIGMCLALFQFGNYYGSPASIQFARDHRISRSRNIRNFQLGLIGIDVHEEHAEKALMQTVDENSFVRPLLTPIERDIYIYSSLVMIGLNVPIFITSIMLLIGAKLRKPTVMFIWVVSMIPYLVIDTIYHSLLFYTLLAFSDLDVITLIFFHGNLIG